MKSEESELAEVAADLPRRRGEEQPRELGKIQFREIPPADDGTRAEEIAAREAAESAARQSRILSALDSLQRTRGERYAGCTLAGFRCDHGPQTLAVEKLRSYCMNIGQHAAEGQGVFLFGACGTGKDHLAMAVAVAFVRTLAEKVAWASGAMLFEQLRDSFDGKKTEREVMRDYRTEPLLWISDPLPVKGELTQYQAEALYRLIDARYNARKPVLVTANIEPGNADATLGPAIARRLRESTMQVHCNWPAFRK